MPPTLDRSVLTQWIGVTSSTLFNPLNLVRQSMTLNSRTVERRAILAVLLIHTATVVVLISIGQSVWGSVTSVRAYQTLYAIDGPVMLLIDRVLPFLPIPPILGLRVSMGTAEALTHSVIGGVLYAIATLMVVRLSRAVLTRVRGLRR